MNGDKSGCRRVVESDASERQTFNMSGLDKFRASIAIAGSQVARRTMEADREGMSEWMTDALMGAHSGRPVSSPVITSDERFTVKVLKGFSEIWDSLESLETIAKLARRAPTTASGIDPAAQLRLLVEAWYHETYILSERCGAFLTFVEREYRKDATGSATRVRVDALRAAVSAAFRPVVGVRGAHVHNERYSDFELRRLGTLSILSTTDDTFAGIRRLALRDARRNKVGWLDARNSEVRKLLDLYFGELKEILFVSKGEPRYPRAA